MPYIEDVRIRSLEERIAKYQQYIEDLEIQLYGRISRTIE